MAGASQIGQGMIKRQNARHCEGATLCPAPESPTITAIVHTAPAWAPPPCSEILWDRDMGLFISSQEKGSEAIAIFGVWEDR